MAVIFTNDDLKRVTLQLVKSLYTSNIDVADILARLSASEALNAETIRAVELLRKFESPSLSLGSEWDKALKAWKESKGETS